MKVVVVVVLLNRYVAL
jgi:uncharacterized protein YbjQ (UPF0145 family)